MEGGGRGNTVCGNLKSKEQSFRKTVSLLNMADVKEGHVRIGQVGEINDTRRQNEVQNDVLGS
jgi:hypothetical protein